MNCKRRKYASGWSVVVLALIVLLADCSNNSSYHSFADRPGFREYYSGRCTGGDFPVQDRSDELLLLRYRPRIILPPGGLYPIDFYRDYIPHTVMRSWPEGSVVHEEVTRETLSENSDNRGVYLDLHLDGYREAGLDRRQGEQHEIPLKERRPVIYGRAYREQVAFPYGENGEEKRQLIFLKYNLVFPFSGLPAELSSGSRALLRLSGFDRDDWHELDNFVAIHIVLDEKEQPIAIILAQHNHHRSYLLGKDMEKPEDGRLGFDVALRSNEIYPASIPYHHASGEPARHRVIRWSLYLDYLLSGENEPFLKGFDVTVGREMGGQEIDYDLAFLSPCDPLYTAQMLLGEPRPFWWGIYLGRDGPPGSDYYNLPGLLPMGNLLKFGYLQDMDQEDIEVVREAIDRKAKTMDIDMIIEHGGRTFLEDWREVQGTGLGAQGEKIFDGAPGRYED